MGTKPKSINRNSAQLSEIITAGAKSSEVFGACGAFFVTLYALSMTRKIPILAAVTAIVSMAVGIWKFAPLFH